jgi:hypothetical protein
LVERINHSTLFEHAAAKGEGMPLEVRQIGIRIQIDQDAEAPGEPSPRLSAAEPVRIEITSNGSVLDLDAVVSVETWDESNRVPRARIVVADGRGDETSFPFSQSGTFAPGAKIVVAAGYGSQCTTIHSGVVVRHSLQITPGACPELIVETADPGGGDVDDVVGGGEADIAGASRESLPVLKLEYGESIISFDATIGSAAPCAGGALQGTVQYQGNALARPGSLVTLAGLGARFDGDVFVSGVAHIIRAGKWRTVASLGMGADGTAASHA